MNIQNELRAILYVFFTCSVAPAEAAALQSSEDPKLPSTHRHLPHQAALSLN